MDPNQLRASKLIGMNVYGPDNKSIGDIDDLIVDKDGQKIQAAVVSVGGFLGIGEKHVAIPMNDVKMNADNRLTVNMSKEQLEQAPKFEYADRQQQQPASGSTAPAGSRPATPPAGGSGGGSGQPAQQPKG